MTDHELLEKVQNRDSAAFSELFKRYSSIIYTLTSKILEDDELGREEMTEIARIIWKKSNLYNPQIQNAYSWIMHLTRNKAVYRLKKSQSPETVDDYSDEFENYFIIPHLSNLIDTLDLETAMSIAPDIEQSLMNLTEAQQYVIYLAFYTGLDQSEIAAKLNMPVAAVKSKVKQALVNLRYNITNEESGGEANGMFESLIFPYALGCLEKDDFINLVDYLSTVEEFPWQLLGEYQNLIALLPSFLNMKEVVPDLTETVIRQVTGDKPAGSATSINPRKTFLSNIQSFETREEIPEDFRVPSKIEEHFNIGDESSAPVQPSEEEDVTEALMPPQRNGAGSRPGESTQIRNRMGVPSPRSERGGMPPPPRNPLPPRPVVNTPPPAAPPSPPVQQPAVPETNGSADSGKLSAEDIFGSPVYHPDDADQQNRVQQPEQSYYSEPEQEISQTFEPEVPQDNRPINPSRLRRRQIYQQPAHTGEVVNDGGYTQSEPMAESIGRTTYVSPEPALSVDELRAGRMASVPYAAPVQAPPESAGLAPWLFWLVSILLFGAIGGMYYVFSTELQSLKDKVGGLTQGEQNEAQAAQNTQTAPTEAGTQRLMNFLINTRNVDLVNLEGIERFTDAYAKIFYNRNLRTMQVLYTNIKSLQLGANLGLQLWFAANPQAAPVKVGKVFRSDQNFDSYLIENTPDINTAAPGEMFVTSENVDGRALQASPIRLMVIKR